jgi:hypothetical protein
MTHQQSRWEKISTDLQTGQLPVVALRTKSRIPNLVMGDLNADPMLAIGGQLRTGLQPGQQASMRIWLLGKEKHLQDRLRTLVSYSYGTESGVSDKDTPNPWGIRLGFLRVVLMIGVMVAAICGGLLGAGWINPLLAALGIMGADRLP